MAHDDDLKVSAWKQAVRHQFGRGSEFLLELEEEVAWTDRVVYDGHTVKRKGSKWLLVIRSHDKKGNRNVAFYERDQVIDCFRELYRDLCVKSTIPWKPDKFSS